MKFMMIIAIIGFFAALGCLLYGFVADKSNWLMFGGFISIIYAIITTKNK